jgi:hypothetical protein
MRRTFTTRVVAAVLAVVAGFSGPALALAHGVAHMRYAASASRYAAQSGAARVALDRATDGTGGVESSESPTRYPEAIHCQQCAERNNIVKLAMPVAVETVVAFVPVSSTPAVGPLAWHVDSSHEFAPDQPRAPPQLS